MTSTIKIKAFKENFEKKNKLTHSELDRQEGLGLPRNKHEKKLINLFTPFFYFHKYNLNSRWFIF